MRRVVFLFLLGVVGGATAAAQPYRNTQLSVANRVEDLLRRLTTDQKIALMVHESPAIDSLGVRAYNWWNEALHGVARSSYRTTVFPQAIGLAAAFDAPLLERAAEAIADEARAIYHNELRKTGRTAIYHGLTFWTPNVNIFRDPRWGRGQETYGEDPWLSGTMGLAMVRGLQGSDPVYLKTSACAKHFAVHSGPEHNRHEFNAAASPYDLWDTYLPAFRTLVGGGVSSVMCAYNRLDGEPCCASDRLLRGILLNRWGFKGYVVSDCWAVSDFWQFHKTHPDAATGVADAVLHGTDLECGNNYPALRKALLRGLISTEQIDVAVRRILTIRFRLGMFDPDDQDPYATADTSAIEAPSHAKLALELARRSLVLLKNDRTLPFDPRRVRRVALIGPNADNGETQLGNYHGTPSVNTTVRAALEARGVEVLYAAGCGWTEPDKEFDLEHTLAQIASADAVVFVGGISARLEGEAGDAGNDMVEGFAGGDRTSIELPEVQQRLIAALKKTKKPLVLVNMSGSAVAFGRANDAADAVVQAWYGGQAAGTAVAELLYGDFCPSGRLPVTFYRSTTDLPDFEDYSMANRTYRYFEGRPLYPFGYGLGYTSFAYSAPSVSATAAVGDSVMVSVEVRNTGRRAGEEVVQLYVSHRPAVSPAPTAALRGVRRVALAPGERRRVEFTLSARDLAYTAPDGALVSAPHAVRIFVGGCSPQPSDKMYATLSLTGDPVVFETP